MSSQSEEYLTEEFKLPNTLKDSPKEYKSLSQFSETNQHKLKRKNYEYWCKCNLCQWSKERQYVFDYP